MDEPRERRQRPAGPRADAGPDASARRVHRAPIAEGEQRRARTAPVSTRQRTEKRTTSSEIHTRRRRTPAEQASAQKRARRKPTRRPEAGAAAAFFTRAGRTDQGPRALLPVGRGIVALLTVVVLLATGYSWNKISSLNSSVTMLGGLGLGGGADGAVDILLVGTDSRLDAQGQPLTAEELEWLRVGDEVTTSTDTILLIRIPNDGTAATAISIPRDAYVEVPGLGKSKINAAYGATREGVRRQAVESGVDEATAEAKGTKAGRKALIESVANLTGVTVDHYAEVGLLGFALLTDAVDGVQVCLKNRVREPMSGARFRKGVQTLDGPQALSFVRQRHDLPRGDLDRITRQQVYMASLAGKILSTQTLTNPTKLQDLENAVSRSVVLDDGWDILKLAEQLKDLTGGSVKFTTIPVVAEDGWSEDGSQSVVEVNPDQVRTFVDRQLGGGADPNASGGRSGYSVEVVNAGTVDGLASNVSGLLTAKGYREGATSTKPMNEFDSIVFAKSADSPAAKQLVTDLGGGIEIREDPALADDQLRAVLTNTYTGLGAIWNTGSQGENANDTSSPTGTAQRTSRATAAIKADTDGPICVN